MFQQAVRGLGRSALYVWAGIIQSIILVVASFVTVYWLKLSLNGLLVANVAAVGISTIALIIWGRLYRYLKIGFDLTLMRQMLRYSLPLLPNSMGWWMISYASRYIIFCFLGSAANGVFAISSRLPLLVMMFADIFYMAWQEKVVKAQSDDRQEDYSLILEKYIKVLFSIAIVLSTFSKLLIYYLVDTAFSDAWIYVPILLYAMVLQALTGFYGVGYLASKDTIGAFSSTFWGGLITVCGSLVFVKLLGLSAIAMAVLAGFSVVLVIRIYGTRRFLSVRFPAKLFFTLSIAFVLHSSAGYFVGITSVVYLMTLVTSLLLVAALNRSYLISMASIIKN